MRYINFSRASPNRPLPPQHRALRLARSPMLPSESTTARETTARTVHRTNLRGLEKIGEGKVRDIYAVDADSMLIVTTDRLSAFDVVLPDPIPEKGRVLNEISNFWFERTRRI